MKLMKSFLFTALMMCVAVTVFAQSGRMQRGPANRTGQVFFDRIQQANQNRPLRGIPDLTEEQQEQIESLQLENRQQMITLQNQLREQEARLRTLTTGSEPDQSAAEGVIDQIAASRASIMKSQLALRMRIRELLTDEQRTLFDLSPRGFPAAVRGFGTR